MAYISNSTQDRVEMLKAIGVKDFEELIDHIPKRFRLKEKLKLPEPQSELEITEELNLLASRNKPETCFLGGGAYDHYIPAVVRHILWRSEFYTAYTPYQAEVSQGTSQTIYEYQTMICRSTGMEVANASMYDGGSALAEAVLLAINHTGRNRILVVRNLHPHYLDIIKTYTENNRTEIVLIDTEDGIINRDSLLRQLTSETAAVVVQNPNFFGLIENLNGLDKPIHDSGALFIHCVDPISLAVLKPPGDLGADLVVGEGQGMGNPINFGGPFLGIFAGKRELIRKMPGRIVAQTQDAEGKRAFVTALQTREQHIRREKATSNICTNSQLCALAALIYLSLMGKSGLRLVAGLCLQNSHYLAEKILELPGYQLKYSAPFFKEFVVKTPIPPGQIIQALQRKDILAGIDLSQVDMGEGLLVAVTEKRTREEMNRYVRALQELNS
ncbi:MAG: aminomethyl-transferring glycine dehydrogenase subunit GcvPA [Calditrichia bacterium]